MVIFEDLLPMGHEAITKMMDYEHGKWAWLSALDESPTDLEYESYFPPT